MAELRAKLEPGFVIDHRPDEPVFVQVMGPITQYRVGVRSLVDVSGVELVVNHLKIADLPSLLNLHLRPMHDRDHASGTKRVKLHARKENYWDLLTNYGAKAMESGHAVVTLNYLPTLGQFDLAAGYYEFELMATGDSAPETTMIAAVKIGNDGAVDLNLRDGRLSNAPFLNR